MKLKLSHVKTATKFVVGFSTGHCIRSIVHNSLAPTNTREKVEVAVGSYVVGAMVADQAEDWTDRTIDRVVDAWKNASN